eukprot:8824875-Pyramimonas_sp.AAC.1
MRFPTCTCLTLAFPGVALATGGVAAARMPRGGASSSGLTRTTIATTTTHATDDITYLAQTSISGHTHDSKTTSWPTKGAMAMDIAKCHGWRHRQREPLGRQKRSCPAGQVQP